MNGSNKLNCLLLLFGITSTSVTFAQKVNPLINKLNQPIDFKAITADNISEAAKEGIAATQTGLDKIYSIPGPKRTFENTVRTLDDYTDQLSSVFSPINILFNASPDFTIRKEAEESIEVVSKFFNQLALDEKLYKAYKEYAETADAKKLTGGRKKDLKETIEEFERNGFGLPADKRAELKQINDRISDLGLQFNRNIATYKDQLLVSEADMKGLPADYVGSRKKEGDMYVSPWTHLLIPIL